MKILQLFLLFVTILALSGYCMLMLFFSISKKDTHIRMFMLVLAAFILWAASGLFMELQLFPGVLFWNRSVVTAMVAIPFLYYCFISTFKESINIFRTIIWGILTAVAVTVNLLGFVMTSITAVTNAAAVGGQNFATGGFIYSFGRMAIPLYAFMFVFLV